MSEYRKWLIGFLICLLTGAAAIIGLTIYVDPFFQYHKPLKDFPYLVDNQMSQNPGLARNMDYDSVLLGSSMTVSFNTDWFEEVLGLHTQKLSYNGAFPKDQSNIMKIIFQNKKDQVKEVFLGIDEENYSADTETTKFSIPQYLYDNNYINDVEYVLNKDVLLNYILRPVADQKDKSDWAEIYKPWWQDEHYKKALVLMYYEPAELVETEAPDDFFIEGAKANLDQNICPYIEAHPETEFTFFYPPYSILYWNDVVRQNQLSAVINEMQYMTERLLKYNNVRVFFFQNKQDIVCNLNNYADYTHYHKSICNYIVHCFENGECELTESNLESELEDMKKLATEYDYEAIYDDWYN